MTRPTMKKRVLPLALGALASGPALLGSTSIPAWAYAAHAKSTKSQTFKGPVEYVDHGPVQVSIVVKGKKITDVKVGLSPEGGRSVSIQSQAILILKQETLTAQSARINEVSGATDTSGGYITSLQAAIKSAKKVKALK